MALDALRVREVFDRAADLTEAERASFLARECAEDPELRHRVEALISADAHAGEFLAGQVAARSEAPEVEPTMLGRWNLIELLGRGGMGAVYRATHSDTGAAAAVKCVRVAGATMLAGIRREIHALSLLDHPGIVRILEHGIDCGMPWYAMELLEGASLRRHIGLPTGPDGVAIPSHAVSTHDLRRYQDAGAGSEASEPTRLAAGGRLPELCALVRDLSLTLAYLHGEGIVHRDLKPDNVVVRAGGRPVLIDFGLSSPFSGALSRETLDTSIDASGTAAYVAPEQLLGTAVDARADLYSLGCILYELSTGHLPFAPETLRETMARREVPDPVAPSTLAPGVPEALDSLVMALLRRDPRRRPGHAEDVAAALAPLCERGSCWNSAPSARAYLYRPALAGRDEALQQIKERVRAAARGHGAMVLVSGESGVGKTRLCLEVSSWAHAQGIGVVSGECDPPGGAGAINPSLHLFRRLLVSLGDACRAGDESATLLMQRSGKLLARYQPSLSGLPAVASSPEPEPLLPERERERLAGVIARCLEAAAPGPALLLLDDLQWADEMSAGILAALVRTGWLARRPMLVMGVHRSEEHGKGTELLLGIDGIERMALARLDASAVGEMVADMLAVPAVPARFLDFLALRSEGNPFFVAEYLREAIACGALGRDAPGSWRIPETSAVLRNLALPGSIRDLVERRLHGLPAAALDLVRTLAVLGREAHATLLESATDLADEALLGSLQTLLSRHVLEEPTLGLYRFAHDRIREVAYDGIPDLEKAPRHRAAALALEGLPEQEREANLAAVARHWEKADKLERALPAYRAAARAARRRFLFADAEQLYRSYISLCPESVESVTARRELAEWVLQYSGRTQEALSELESALDAARRLDPDRLAPEIMLSVGTGFRMMGRLDEAESRYREALERMRATGRNDREPWALYLLSVLREQRGDSEGTEGFAREALAIYKARNDGWGVRRCLGVLAAKEHQAGALEEARRLYREALEVEDSPGEDPDRIGRAAILSNFSCLLFTLGELREARRGYEEAIEVYRAAGIRSYEASTRAALAHLLHAEGDLEGALAASDSALQGLRDTLDVADLALCLHQRSALLCDLGRHDEALRAARESLDLARSASATRLEGQALVALARIARLRADLDAAKRLSAEALRLLDDPIERALASLEQGHTALAAGEDPGPMLALAEETVRRLELGDRSPLATAARALHEAAGGGPRG